MAWGTRSRVTIGTPSGTPSSSSAGPAVAMRPLVAIAQAQPISVSRASRRARARQRAHLADPAPVRLGVPLLQAQQQRLVELAPGLAQQRAREQAAAHADAPVDAPHRELDAGLLQRLVPRQHVLIDAVDQRAVEIEDQGRCRHVSLPRRRGDRDLRLCCRASRPVDRNPIDLLAARRRVAAITMWPPPRVAAASPSLWRARHARRPSAPPSPERVRCGPPARCRPSRPAPALGRCRAGRSPAPA